MSRPNIIPCASCGLENNILSRKQAKEFNCFNCGADLQLAIQNYDKLQKNTIPTSEETNTLSDKYVVLEVMQYLLWTMLGVEIVGGIYCGIKIIDFLFDLDKVKSARV